MPRLLSRLLPCVAVLLLAFLGTVVQADSGLLPTDHRLCPSHHQLAGPEELRVVRGSRAGDLRVLWKPVATTLSDTGSPLSETFITVIVDDGQEAMVRKLPLTAVDVTLDSVPRDRDLAVMVALTRQADRGR